MTDDDEKWFKMLTGKEKITDRDDFSLQVARYFGERARESQNKTVDELKHAQTQDDYQRGLQKVLSKLRENGLIDEATPSAARQTEDEDKQSLLSKLSQQLQELLLGVADRIDPALADDGEAMESNQDSYELVVNGEVQISIQVTIDSSDADLATVIVRFSETWLNNPSHAKALQSGVVIMAEGKPIISGEIIDGELSGVVENYSELSLSKQWLVLSADSG